MSSLEGVPVYRGYLNREKVGLGSQAMFSTEGVWFRGNEIDEHMFDLL